MSIFSQIKNLLTNPKISIVYRNKLGLNNRMSDEEFYRTYFKIAMGKELDLDNPQTYNEKLQWLKLYDRNPLYTKLVDKAEVKGYIADLIGEEYIIPTIGVYDSFDEINFDELPDQFVMKVTHDSGGVVICKDKSKLDIKAAKKTVKRALWDDYYRTWREWPYKDVKHRIIIEKYLEDSTTKDLRDYKFFAFDGKVKALFVATERQSDNSETKFDFFDADYNHLDFVSDHPNADTVPEKPKSFEKMKEIAEILAQGFIHVRVDLYEVDGKIYFGELTFLHNSGFHPFEPEEWDYKFGSWIKLPIEK